MIARGDFLGGLAGAMTVAAVPVNPLPAYTPTVSIGVVAPLSGPYRAAGQALVNGVQGAINYQNELRTSLQKAYTLRTFDDQNAIADAIVNAQFTIDDGTIVAVIGHLGAKGTLAALQTYAQAQMPLLVPAVTADALTAQGYHNVFRLPTKDSIEGELLANYIMGKYAPAAPHIVVQDGDYGADVARGYARRFLDKKIDSKVTVFSYEKPDYHATAAAVANDKPDHVMLAGTAQDMGPIVKPLRDNGYAGPLAASQGFFDALTASTYGKECAGIVISTSMPDLAIAASAYRETQEYASEFGALAPVSAFGYAAAEIIMSQVSRSGATTRNALNTSMGLGGAYSTIVGSFTFSPTGDPIDPELYFYTVADGKFAYLRQSHPSAFSPR